MKKPTKECRKEIMCTKDCWKDGRKLERKDDVRRHERKRK